MNKHTCIKSNTITNVKCGKDWLWEGGGQQMSGLYVKYKNVSQGKLILVREKSRKLTLLKLGMPCYSYILYL